MIRSRETLCRDMGAAYKFVVAPSKEAVLSDHLPDDMVLSDNRPAVQIASDPLLESIVNYPLKALRTMKSDPFHKGDSHWSDSGGLEVFHEIMAPFKSSMKLVLPSTVSRTKESLKLQISQKDIMGDLAVHTDTPQAERVTQLNFNKPAYKVVLDNRKPNRSNMIITENNSVSTKTVVVFRDSFSQVLIPYFAATFSRCVFYWNPFVDYDLLEQEKPGLVLNIMAERFLPVIPDDVHKFSWEEVSVLKRAKT